MSRSWPGGSPNPNDGHFNVVAEGLVSSNVQLDVIDLTGRTLLQQRITASGGRVREMVSTDMPAGTYLVKVTDGELVRTVRLIVH